ncbi:MAG TPA: HU family DNA-binding protein [Casimicrobiaceae bacterium]|nr:HU family DNA-binding protein [Casimicrobiaceae bacterium]
MPRCVGAVPRAARAVPISLDTPLRRLYKVHPASDRGPPTRVHRKRRTAVNKSDLIDAIARHADISKAAAERALDATLNTVKGALKKGEIVTLVGFGSFFVGRRTARQGRNPRTGATIKIRAAKVPKFRPGKALKDAVN